ncbi:MAG: HlyD family type I secretion periplasmic adaptor subunit [Campylobacteraceae bacterium]|nr:HlyD family type I secretion periplasmic adaptor subunit [Campylobacteraceae bacterium]
MSKNQNSVSPSNTQAPLDNSLNNKDIKQDINKANLHVSKIKNEFKGNYDIDDLKYMSSLSEAILAKSPSTSKAILWLVMIACFWLIFWASQAEIDERTRTNGKIIPSNRVQIVQNLEGGIVSEILVREGDTVKQGDILVKIENKSFSSSYGESKLKLGELEAKYKRLDAEANNKSFIVNTAQYQGDAEKLKAIRYEKSLYDSNKAQLNQTLQILKEQLKQRKSDLRELSSRIAQLKSRYELMQNEVDIMRPLAKKGLVSQVEFLQIRRQATQLKGELDSARLSVPRARAASSEINKRLKEAKLSFINKAKTELNEVASEIARISETQTSLEDRVKRTEVRSPTHGTISRLMVNTISGVIKPGQDIAEIVPLNDALIAEVKVQPKDVAFLRIGLKAMVKFTAYDFSIYGGLEGKVINVGADTITDKKGNSYYLARIETEKNHLGTPEKPLPIRTGMVVSADILTGKKTILDYLLKPILKAKQNALSER